MVEALHAPGLSVTFKPGLPLERAQRQLAAIFRQHGIEQPGLDARILLCAAVQIDHAALIRDSHRALGPHSERLIALAQRRLKGEPVSRILGYREFWGERFALSPGVLDPRPDTETLVEAILEHALKEPQKVWRILELGIGSGAVLAAILLNLPRAFGFGVDISYAACQAAKSNLDGLALGQRAMVIRGDWMKALGGKFDIIVSNPPYIKHAALAGLDREVRDYDPVGALDGGADGLDAYRSLIPELETFLAKNGIAAFELGIGQYKAAEALFHKTRLRNCRVRLDLAGRERVILAQA